MTTMADGIAVASPGDLTLAHCAELVDEVRTVTEEDLSRALLFCLERAKLVVEPAGVAAVAAVLADPAAFAAAGGRGRLRRQHRPGAAAEGGPARHGRRRPLPVAAAARARPAGVAGRGAAPSWPRSAANVLEVEHERTTARLHLGEVEVVRRTWRPAAPTTRGEVVAALAAGGRSRSTADR